MGASDNVRPWAVLIKGLVFFLLINYAFALPVFRNIYRLSFYNTIVPGKLGFGVSADLDIMLMSNNLSARKAADEFRVFVSGDSSVAGAGLKLDERFVYLLNQQGLRSCGGKRMVFYNLGSPYKSLVKDLLILDRAVDHQPDLIVHFLTLETLLPGKQFDPIVVKRNPAAVNDLIDTYKIDLAPYPEDDIEFLNIPTDHTLWGERNKLYAWVRENMNAMLYAADLFKQEREGGDDDPEPAAIRSDLTFSGWKPGDFREEELQLGLARHILDLAGTAPVIFVNEPILIAPNLPDSAARYNKNYPRWVYDEYRVYLAERMADADQPYLDLWDAVPAEYFGNSAFHRKPQGEIILMEKLIEPIVSISCGAAP
jgi:hypothetical protein